MKIDFTRDEYLRLMELVEIAIWIVEGHQEDSRPETRPYVDLEQKLFAAAESMGCGELAEWDEDAKTLFPSAEFQETLDNMNFIPEFEDNTFWDQLIVRLAERDLIREKGEEMVGEMIPEERYEVERPHADRYYEEFRRNGLENVTLRV